MRANQSACDPQRLTMFLEHRLGDQESRELETHLGECEQCRLDLEARSASPDFWDGVGQLLGEPADGEPADGEPADSDSPATTDIRSRSNPGQSNQHDVASIKAYLKTWLAPSESPVEKPDSIGRLGGYEITGVVGVGGMGMVLKGFDRSLNRYVAIKVLASHLASNGSARKRFSREAQAAAAVVHENVLAIHAIDSWQGMPYLVMPYVRGESLEKRLQRSGSLEVVEILRIARQIAAGLSAAHAQGLVHRDIKPANILLDEGSERLKISDFGLARAADDASLTHSGTIAGTPMYMSPEQARGESVDSRSDLFSFGSLLFALCTGHPPFRAETPYGIIRRICEESPRAIQQSNPQIPTWLCGIIERMMQRDMQRRFGNARQLERIFTIALTHIQQQSMEPLPPELQAYVPLQRKRIVRWALPASLMIIAATAMAGTLYVCGVFGGAERAAGSAAANRLLTNNTPAPPAIEQQDEQTSPTEEQVPENAEFVPLLRYSFVECAESFYLCRLMVARGGEQLTIDGLISLRVDAVLEDGAELVYELQLNHRTKGPSPTGWPWVVTNPRLPQTRTCAH